MLRKRRGKAERHDLAGMDTRPDYTGNGAPRV